MLEIKHSALAGFHSYQDLGPNELNTIDQSLLKPYLMEESI